MSAMMCRDTVAAMMDYVDGRLDVAVREALETHLRVCPRCAEFLSAYRATPLIVRRATEGHLPAERALRVQQRLQALLRENDRA
jgi:anti-sigma factor RsiW